MKARTTRDRILDALQRILLAKGSSAVTLDAVAAEAEVSKGGLLYHFPSKEAMLTGLVRRLGADAEVEFEECAEAEEGVTRFFLETSLPRTSEEASLYWSVIAALRSAEDASGEADEIIHHIFDRWRTILHEDIGDPVLAETVRLVGDGLYLSAIAGLPQPDPDLLRSVIADLVERVQAAKKKP